MKLLSKVFLLLVFLSLLISCKAKSIQTTEPLKYQALANKINKKLDKKIVRLQKEFNIPNVGVGIIKNGEITGMKVYGKLKNGKPAPINMLFGVASISKAVFATLVMKLVKEGKWDLDEPLYKYHIDPDIVDNPFHKKLTARIILSHQSGFSNWRRYTPSRKLTFNFEPGNGYQYSGEGFYYLQRAIEKKFNKSLDELAEEKIFSPIGMKDSRYGWDGKKDLERFSRWFDTDGNEYEDESYSTEANSASSLLTTVEDLSKFGIEVLNKKRLGENLYKEMISKQRRISPNLEQGIGWRVINGLKNNEYAIQHGGNHRGVSAMLVLLPNSKSGVVVITNSFNGFMLVNEVVREVLPLGGEIIHKAYRSGSLDEIPKIVAIDRKLLNSYVGTYLHPNGTELNVIRKGNMLQTRMERTRDYRYFAESKTLFFQKDLAIKLEFTKDDKGMVNAILIINGDNVTKFLRKK